MIRLLLFDLGETLIHGGTPFPHVLDALAELSEFHTEDSEKLAMGIVSDFGEPTASNEELATLESQFAEILNTAGIGKFFMPFATKVTISARAGAFKPDRRMFEAALQRSGINATLAECLFITENHTHLIAARNLGLTILGFGNHLTNVPSFSRWMDAPGIIATLVAPDDIQNRERAILVALKEQHDLTAVKCLSHNNTVFRCQGTRLQQLQHPQLGDLAGIFVEIPVDISAQLTGQGTIENVTIGDITDDDINDTARYIQRLARKGQIASDPTTLAPGTTHAVQTDSVGRKVLVRQRFSK